MLAILYCCLCNHRYFYFITIEKKKVITRFNTAIYLKRGKGMGGYMI